MDYMLELRRNILLIPLHKSRRHRLRKPCIAFLMSLTALASAYSQISVPGVSNRSETDGMVEEIIEAESAPIRRNEARIEDYELEREIWNELAADLNELQDTANALYSFRNPFSERLANASDTSVLTAAATREAPESLTDVEVLETASADVFRSSSLPDDYEIPAGRYTFAIGDSSITVPFEGGTVTDFAAIVNRRAAPIVEIRTVRDTPDSRVLTFEGQVTGASNRLRFADDAENLAIDTETIQPRATESEQDIAITEARVSPGDGERENVELSDDTLVLGPTAQARVRSESRIPIEEGMVLSIDIFVENLGRETFEEPEPPAGPSIPDPGETELGGIRVPYASQVFELPEWQPPEPPVEVDDLNIISLLDGGTEVAIPALDDTDGFETLEIAVGEELSGLTAIDVHNRSTFRRVSLTNIRVYDPSAEGDFEPVRALATARDARLIVDGIEVTRDTNEIDDLVEGVTLTLNNPGETQLQVEPDFETIKEAIIEFLALYNQIMVQVNILTRTNPEIITQVSWLSEDEVADAEERLGLLQGDSTLNQLRTRLQTIMMNPYETRLGSDLRILQQIGVSSNASGPGGGIDTRQLRGYLEMNEATLDDAIAQNHRAIRDLFGFDTDGDGVVNAGAAFEVFNYVRGFTQTGGIVAVRTQGLDRRISDATDQIERDSERLERREAQLQREFAQMEATMDSAEDMRRRLEGLNSNQNQ